MATSPRKPTKTKSCNMQQLAFVRELLCDEYMNASQAYMRVYKVSAKVAHANAARLMAEAHIKLEIKHQQADRSKRTGINKDAVLTRLWAIATADPNTLMQLRRLNCRYCHGIDHAYQWKDELEFEQACALEEKEAKEEERLPRLPTDAGGYGYQRTEAPHDDCPKCAGEGYEDVHFEDTRYLTGASKFLYAGVKQTQHGIEIKTRDQDAAIIAVGRHLGMFNDKLTLLGDKENPLALLVKQMNGVTLTPGGEEE